MFNPDHKLFLLFADLKMIQSVTEISDQSELWVWWPVARTYMYMYAHWFKEQASELRQVLTVALVFIGTIGQELHVAFGPLHTQQVLLLSYYLLQHTGVVLPENTWGERRMRMISTSFNLEQNKLQWHLFQYDAGGGRGQVTVLTVLHTVRDNK